MNSPERVRSAVEFHATEESYEAGLKALEQGHYLQARTLLETHLAHTTGSAEVYANLASACFLLKDFVSAHRYWKKALECEWLTEVAENILESALELMQKSHFYWASEYYALLTPGWPGLRGRQIWALCCDNRISQAEHLLHSALTQNPYHLELRLLDTFLWPQFYASAAEMQQWRARFQEKLTALENDLPHFEACEGDLLVGSPIFGLSLLGQNERENLQRVSHLWRKLFVPATAEQAEFGGHPPPLRLGWVSFSLHSHSTADYFKKLVTYFCHHPAFDNAIFYFGSSHDEVTAEVAAEAQAFFQLKPDLEQGLRTIRDWQPDILFYLDIGQEAMLYTLAHYRLAPLQCVSSGVPLTTGIATIDTFISCQYFEPPQAQDNYSEKLILLANPAWQIQVPTLSPPQLQRADFGLSDSQTLYLFPHTIFRLDPDLDQILVAILKQDPRAHLVLLRYRETSLHEYIQQRLAPQLSTAEQQRITWLPWLPQNHFLQLLTLADIALDGLYLGGGLVTYQCFAMGLPIVHKPSNQLRCRIAAALYQIAGLEEWIARDRHDYLDKALKLGTQPLLRQQLKAAIRAAYPRLFENQQGLEELADFFIGQFKEKNHAIHTR